MRAAQGQDALTGKRLEKDDDLELIVIYEIGKILSASLDLQKSIRQVLGVLSSYLEMRRGMVSLVQTSGDLHVVSASGLSAEEMLRGRFRVGEGV
ncbi:MAG: nif-specific transcriptional activator NifA, partial [Gammaproteobacteria bacterium]|nr:nif-specific transcriptional activator NifA [Gammaproteobacteria bacterium]